MGRGYWGREESDILLEFSVVKTKALQTLQTPGDLGTGSPRSEPLLEQEPEGILQEGHLGTWAQHSHPWACSSAGASSPSPTSALNRHTSCSLRQPNLFLHSCPLLTVSRECWGGALPGAHLFKRRGACYELTYIVLLMI